MAIQKFNWLSFILIQMLFCLFIFFIKNLSFTHERQYYWLFVEFQGCSLLLWAKLRLSDNYPKLYTYIKWTYSAYLSFSYHICSMRMHLKMLFWWLSLVLFYVFIYLWIYFKAPAAPDQLEFLRFLATPPSLLFASLQANWINKH